MKKILSFLAAGALALGLIGCSGDLHDAVPAPLGVMGIDTSICIPMEFEGTDNSVQTLKFTWSADATLKNIKGDEPKVQEGWGGSARLQFKIILPSGINADGTPDWSKDRAGDDNYLFITLNASEPTKLLSREESGAGNPQHVVVEGLVDGEEYVLTAYYDATKESVSVTCTGVASDPSQFRIVAENSLNFPAKDKDGENIIYAMTKGDGSYEYQFIAAESETISYKVENDLVGVTDSQSLIVEKDQEYKIVFSKKPGESGLFKTENIDILKKAELISNRGPADYDFYKTLNFATNRMIVFESDGNPFKFYLKRDSSGDMFWDTGSITELGKETSLRYVDNRNVAGDKNFKASDVSYISVPAFEKGVTYGLIFDGDLHNLTATIKENAPFEENYNVYVAGGQDVFKGYFDDTYGEVVDIGWNNGYVIAKTTSDSGYYIEFTYTGPNWSSDGDTAFGIVAATEWNDWKGLARYVTTGKVAVGSKNNVLIPGSSNVELTGLEKGKKYKLTLYGLGDVFAWADLEAVE